MATSEGRSDFKSNNFVTCRLYNVFSLNRIFINLKIIPKICQSITSSLKILLLKFFIHSLAIAQV